MMEKTPNQLKVNKNRLWVVFITEHNRVEGEVNILDYGRLTDFMNAGDKHFVAVTHAKVYNLLEGKLVYAVDFLDINKNSIFIAFPVTYSAQQAEAQ